MRIFLMKLKTIIRACIAAGAALKAERRKVRRNARPRARHHDDDDSWARGTYDPSSKYSAMPGGINDPLNKHTGAHKWD
jgi:hypothetical protein